VIAPYPISGKATNHSQWERGREAPALKMLIRIEDCIRGLGLTIMVNLYERRTVHFTEFRNFPRADVEGNKVRLSANGDVAVTMEQEG